LVLRVELRVEAVELRVEAVEPCVERDCLSPQSWLHLSTFIGRMVVEVHEPMENEIALVEGVPDGLLLREWAEQNDVGKTTSYALIKILKTMGIVPKLFRKKGASKPSPYLDGDALQVINFLLMQHRDGRSIASLEADNSSAIVQAPQETNSTAFDGSNSFTPTSLLDRLKAAELAISTGLPLTRREACWILGISEKSRLPENTRIRIGRTSFQKWTLLEPTSENLIAG